MRNNSWKPLVSTWCVLLLVVVLSLCAMALPVRSETAPMTETEQLDITDSYYYDHLSEKQQEYYACLKDCFDNYQGEAGSQMFDFSFLVADGATDEECDQLFADFIYADLALKADHPLYKGLGRFNGVGYFRTDDGTLVVTATIDFYDFLTDEAYAETDARIKQIVAAVGEGDRYTKLRRMTAYLLDHTFYDPYLDAINYEGRPDVQKSGADYDGCAYGLFLYNIAICEGFCESVKVLCNELDIPCIIMGNAGHAWNLVQMDDGKWYRLDITNACRLGWDDALPSTLDEYFAETFLNNNTLLNLFGTYNDPYMLALNDVPLVTDFPEHAEGQYIYMGSETDFSYADVQNTYVGGEPQFLYSVHYDGTTCSITDYIGKESGDLIIPDSIDGYMVTEIDEYAFYYCTGFTGKLVIPDTVQSIGRGAFAGCYNLTAAELSANLYDIGRGAFIGCKGLKTLVLPDLLGRIDKYAFYDCDGLETVTFGCHVFEIDDTAFGNIDGNLLIKAPANSAAEAYAAENGMAFDVHGEMCAFVDADGKWDFADMKDDYWRLLGETVHFHVCEHGARFDYTEHSLDVESAECGEKCADCGADYCRGMGYTHTAPYIINKTEADCLTPAYSGDLVCVFGHLIQSGEYVGEPTGEHVPVDDVWRYDADNHYKLCACGWRLEDSSHCGGTATATQRAVCEVCGAEYGELHVHTPVWQESDAYNHYWVCDCGEKLDIEAHYGGTATEYELAICVVCGVAYGEYAEHVHCYEVTVIEAACTEAGCTTHTCSTCGDSYTEELPALGHSFVDGTCERCGEPEIQVGDVNGDGKINARDARLLLRYAAGLVNADEINLAAADYNGDGKINARDARAVLRFAAGLD